MVRRLKRIKAGEGTLIGNAGEHYVMAELLRRGIVAALAPRNAPGFDVLATRRHQTARIRVKTKSAAFDIWQWSAKKDGTILIDLQTESDYTVLVNLTDETKDLEFFIVPSHLLNSWLVAGFTAWVTAPGKNGHVRNASNKKRHLSYSKFAEELSCYRNNWDGLWQALAETS